ncbi:hypothetical protein GLAREA_09651 [Glarea lozoyensis ATCC 20868]|uniref:Uncharacterized protein n=1 Tax=Glarea lozoyensis (strain ATCC 20868 / MF5171) TaxID=1116229 RepID=S3CS73_GLAL2|nr:uncharacterized protein GLAREA_09651 [Glarea lozoyensis ATCC 20868]EPE28530.1 hypothetical protein GLAREA_09651 [Glarea lozoyensis ATCC 20868]
MASDNGSKALYEQERDFLASQAHLMSQPGTSSIPLDPSSPTTQGPSGYNQPLPIVGDRPPSYVGPVRRTSTSSTQLRPVPLIKESSWSKFEVPTKKIDLSSGFAYDERLAPLRISHEEWYQFSSEIGIAAKLTPGEDWAAWTAGITTGTLAIPFLLVWAPKYGYRTGKFVHRKSVQSNVQKKLVGDGELRNVFRKWNQNVFAHKGFQAWLELPSDEKEIKPSSNATKEEKETLKKEFETSKKFKLLILPWDGSDMGPTSMGMRTRQPSVRNIVEADGDQIQTTSPTNIIPPLSEAPPPEAEHYAVSPLSTSTSPQFTTNPNPLPRTISRKELAVHGGEVRHEMAG